MPGFAATSRIGRGNSGFGSLGFRVQDLGYTSQAVSLLWKGLCRVPCIGMALTALYVYTGSGSFGFNRVGHAEVSDGEG